MRTRFALVVLFFVLVMTAGVLAGGVAPGVTLNGKTGASSRPSSGGSAATVVGAGSTCAAPSITDGDANSGWSGTGTPIVRTCLDGTAVVSTALRSGAPITVVSGVGSAALPSDADMTNSFVVDATNLAGSDWNGIESITHDSVAANGTEIAMARTRGTHAAPTAVQSGDSLGLLTWSGQWNAIAGGLVYGPRMFVTATQTWDSGTQAHGSRWELTTTPNSTVGAGPTRMVVDQNGFVGIGPDTTPDAFFDVQGAGNFDGAINVGASGSTFGSTVANLLTSNVTATGSVDTAFALVGTGFAAADNIATFSNGTNTTSIRPSELAFTGSGTVTGASGLTLTATSASAMTLNGGTTNINASGPATLGASSSNTVTVSSVTGTVTMTTGSSTTGAAPVRLYSGADAASETAVCIGSSSTNTGETLAIFATDCDSTQVVKGSVSGTGSFFAADAAAYMGGTGDEGTRIANGQVTLRVNGGDVAGVFDLGTDAFAPVTNNAFDLGTATGPLAWRVIYVQTGITNPSGTTVPIADDLVSDGSEVYSLGNSSTDWNTLYVNAIQNGDNTFVTINDDLSVGRIASGVATGSVTSGTCTSETGTGTDVAGSVTSTCTAGQTTVVTFSTAFGTAPVCTCSRANAAADATAFCDASTTALTVTIPVAQTAGKINYHCLGR